LGTHAGIHDDRSILEYRTCALHVHRVVEATSIPVVDSGGVASVEDVRALADIGAAAVVVGLALYEGRFTLREAQQAV
jgi:phosphoribosylformimino-5-aminoimidazole carboxamide ribotide isomerase